MIPFRDPFEWVESYGRFLLNVRTGGYCAFDQQLTNGLHSHDFHEVCLITAGTGTYAYEGSEFALQAGDIILARPNALHEISSMRTRDLQLVFFAFEIQPGPPIAVPGEQEQLITGVRVSARVHASGHKRLLGYLQVLGRDIDPGWILRRTLSTFLTELLAPFAPGSNRKDESLERHAVARAVEYIDRNIRRSFKVVEIAQALSVSERTLRRYFSNILGKSVTDVVRERKLNRASCLLLMNFDISTICRVLSLEPSHFSRSFKSQFGTSPRNYQKAHRSRSQPWDRTAQRLPPRASTGR